MSIECWNKERQPLVICFYLGWSGSILQFRQNISKVGSQIHGYLSTCSSNITLSLPSYTGSALKLNFCNGYLSLLYFYLHDMSLNCKLDQVLVGLYHHPDQPCLILNFEKKLNAKKIRYQTQFNLVLSKASTDINKLRKLNSKGRSKKINK